MRIAQRHLIPSVLASVYFFLRYRCSVSPRAKVQPNKQISFGTGTVVKPFAIIQTSGGRITIGKHCAISSFDHISTVQAEVIIGDYVRIGPHVTIMGSARNWHSSQTHIVDQGYTHRGVRIGNDVLIGAGAIIMDGCEVGEGAVIGAGSVVTRNVAPYSAVAGAPAAVISQRQ
jgi:acetyltransferase-like isoleucine patch superfamily enzyme